jgi:periplasmic divalent cation tolerance protein
MNRPGSAGLSPTLQFSSGAQCILLTGSAGCRVLWCGRLSARRGSNADMTRNEFAVALVTAPNLRTARKLAKAALQSRLAACVNLVDRIQSHYWWRGKLLADTEVLMLFKTRRAHVAALEKLIIEKHPYEVPEFVVLTLSSGNRRYLAWLTESVANR